MPETIEAILAECAQGQWPAPVALLRLAVAAEGEAQARRALDEALAVAGCNGRLGDLDRLWRSRPSAFALVRDVLRKADHGMDDAGPDRWRDVFDALAAEHPDAAMALYALDDPALLADATGEVADLVWSWGELAPGRRVLDLGCGTARVGGALLARGAEVLGIDVSGRMLAVARRRRPRLMLAQVAGRDLACLRSGSFDAVAAVDVMPYLTRGGGALAGAVLGDIARVLRPGGLAVILNWSYDDAGAGPSEICPALSLVRGPMRPFRLWDGQAWALRARPLAPA